jgi:uncharacterized membrane protein HdeD (DUF308 family)
MALHIDLTPDEEHAVAQAYASTWWLFMIVGILWLLLGFFILSLRPGSITAVAILISIAFWLGAFAEFAVAIVLQGGWRVFAIVCGVLALGAGIATIVWPGPTLLVLSVFVAWYLLIRGIFDVVISLANTHVHGWWLGLVSGVIGIALGAWAIGNPDRSVLLLVTIIGIWAVVKGVVDLVSAFRFRDLKKALA